MSGLPWPVAVVGLSIGGMGMVLLVREVMVKMRMKLHKAHVTLSCHQKDSCLQTAKLSLGLNALLLLYGKR